MILTVEWNQLSWNECIGRCRDFHAVVLMVRGRWHFSIYYTIQDAPILAGGSMKLLAYSLNKGFGTLVDAQKAIQVYFDYPPPRFLYWDPDMNKPETA